MRLKLTYFNFLLKASGQPLQKSKKLTLQSLEEKEKKRSVPVNLMRMYFVNNYKLKFKLKQLVNLNQRYSWYTNISEFRFYLKAVISRLIATLSL